MCTGLIARNFWKMRTLSHQARIHILLSSTLKFFLLMHNLPAHISPAFYLINDTFPEELRTNPEAPRKRVQMAALGNYSE